MSKDSVYVTVLNMGGKHDAVQIKEKLDELRGVLSVSVNQKSSKIAVDYDSTGVQEDQIRKTIECMGFQILSAVRDSHPMH